MTLEKMGWLSTFVLGLPLLAMFSECDGSGAWQGQLVGGFTPQWKPVDKEVTELLTHDMKLAIEGKGGQQYKIFKPVGYQTQVVAGINYRIKIKVGENPDQFIVAKIFKPLPYTKKPPSLTSVKAVETKAVETKETEMEPEHLDLDLSDIHDIDGYFDDDDEVVR